MNTMRFTGEYLGQECWEAAYGPEDLAEIRALCGRSETSMTYMQLNKDGEVETMHRDEDGKMKVTVGPRFTPERWERLETALGNNDFFNAYEIARDSLSTQPWMPPVEVLDAKIAYDRVADLEPPLTRSDFYLRAIEAGKEHIRDIFETNKDREARLIQELHYARVEGRTPHESSMDRIYRAVEAAHRATTIPREIKERELGDD